jgi:hypothetical protein
MKKLFPTKHLQQTKKWNVLLICIFAFALSLKAQTLPVNDFESGMGGAYVAWGGSCSLIENPVKDASNPSDTVLKITSNDFAPAGFPVALPAGKTLKDFTGIRFQAMILEGSQQITWITFNAGVSQNTSTMDIVDPSGGQGAVFGGDAAINRWVDVELQFNETLLASFVDGYTSGNYHVMIKLGRATFYYAVDNVRLIEKETVDPNTIFTFETMDLGPTTRCATPWTGSCRVVANPVKVGINTSDKSLEVTTVEFSPVTFATALPDGKTWSDFDGLTFQFCVTADPNDGRNWGACEMGVRLDNGTHEKIGAAFGETGVEGAAFGAVNLNEWIPITLRIKDYPISTVANTTGKLYIRVMKSGLTYLLDNVTLLPKSASGVSHIPYESQAIKAAGQRGAIRLDVVANTTVSIYGIDGQIVYRQTLLPGTYNVNLPAGVFIVNKEKLIVY